jgi:hypothetical protein
MIRLIVKDTIATTKEEIRRINLAIQGLRRALGLDLVLQGSANNTDTKISRHPTSARQPVSKLCETTVFIPDVRTFSITDLPAQRLKLSSKT